MLIDADELPDGLVVAGVDGVVRLVNRAAERITARPAADLLGLALADALPLTDRLGRSWWDCAHPYTGLASRTGHPERTLALPDGREVLVSARFVREQPLGPVRDVVVSLRDTHARMREELSRAELVSTVAHELRSPLTSVKGFTSTLLRRWDYFTDAQKRLMIETVEADADRVTRLITELLDTARIDSGRVTVRRELVDLTALVSSHIDGIVASGVDAERLVLETDPTLPELWADRDKLHQIVGNLLDNALRHADGVVNIGVRRGGAQGEDVALLVADDGDGVPSDLRERIFTKFWRTGRRGGTGLGLYISRGLIEAQGGRIEITDSDAGGALFRIVLPGGAPDFAR